MPTNLPPWFLPVFYLVCGLLIIVLLYRIWMKNRRSTASNLSQARDSFEPINQRVAATPLTPTAAPSAATRSVTTTSWDDRNLLGTSGILHRQESTGMPRILADEVPGADDSDRTYGSMLNPAFASLLPDTDERRERTRRDLISAGFLTPHALENLSASRYVYMMLALIVFGALLLIVPQPFEPWAIVGLVVGPILGWALPLIRVQQKGDERKREIARAMPDFLDMLNMCVSQGLTVPDSLRRILKDFRGVYPALSQELGIVLEQANITNMHTALENFNRRIDLPEVHSITSLMIQTDRMGTSISDALTTYSDTMRESLKQRADEKGNQATFRLLFPTVFCLMPAVYLFLLGPAVIGLTNFFYSGGRDSLDTGTSAIQRLNAQRASTTINRNR
ncbi:MAG: type II secretion system F family protein [Planctomycetes bacterium]|nr:type II secretion system F family protein [Planctomycetota bacterium]